MRATAASTDQRPDRSRGSRQVARPPPSNATVTRRTTWPLRRSQPDPVHLDPGRVDHRPDAGHGPAPGPVRRDDAQRRGRPRRSEAQRHDVLARAVGPVAVVPDHDTLGAETREALGVDDDPRTAIGQMGRRQQLPASDRPNRPCRDTVGSGDPDRDRHMGSAPHRGVISDRHDRGRRSARRPLRAPPVCSGPRPCRPGRRSGTARRPLADPDPERTVYDRPGAAPALHLDRSTPDVASAARMVTVRPEHVARLRGRSVSTRTSCRGAVPLPVMSWARAPTSWRPSPATSIVAVAPSASPTARRRPRPQSWPRPCRPRRSLPGRGGDPPAVLAVGRRRRPLTAGSGASVTVTVAAGRSAEPGRPCPHHERASSRIRRGVHLIPLDSDRSRWTRHRTSPGRWPAGPARSPRVPTAASATDPTSSSGWKAPRARRARPASPAAPCRVAGCWAGPPGTDVQLPESMSSVGTRGSPARRDSSAGR